MLTSSLLTNPTLLAALHTHESNTSPSLHTVLHNYHDAGEYRYMNPAAPIQHVQTQPHHGIKRSAPGDEVEQSSNISTHFKKLRLNNSNASYTNVPRTPTLEPWHQHANGFSSYSSSSHAQSHEQTYSPSLSAHAQAINNTALPPPTQLQPSCCAPPTPIIPPRTDDFMPLDDTPNRIYISDLDAEIASIEAQEALDNINPSTIFLPDFDKSIARIPNHVLRSGGGGGGSTAVTTGTGMGQSPAAMMNRQANEQALVLYRDPISISVPEEEDVVRKAIIAARKEARAKMRRDHERSTSATDVDVQDRDGMVAQHTDSRRDDAYTNFNGVAYADANNDNNDNDDDAMDIG